MRGRENSDCDELNRIRQTKTFEEVAALRAATRSSNWRIWRFGICYLGFRVTPAQPDEQPKPESKREGDAIVCPVCGAVAVQEKCKVICRSEICRGRVVMNCSEF